MSIYISNLYSIHVFDIYKWLKFFFDEYIYIW
jgi:hypothetical protein